MPLEVILDQLPRTLTIGSRHFSVNYRPVGNEEQLNRILIVMSDVTDTVERARREADQQEQLAIFQHLMRDRAGFMEFFGEAERLADGPMPEPRGDQSAFVRWIHTLKGNSAMFGLTSLSAACHELETKLLEADEGVRPEDWEKWNGIWNNFAAKVRVLAGTGPEDRIELRRVDLQSLRQGIASGPQLH